MTLTWNEGHPEHWRLEMVRQGYEKPPEKHKFVTGSCVYCNHPEYIGRNTPSVDGICIE